MKAAGGGSIVNISSISGVTGQRGIHRRLQRLEGRGAHADQSGRRAARARQHPRQFNTSRADAADALLGTHRRPGSARQDAATACRWAAPAGPRKSPTPSCSSPRTRPPTSPARNSRSMAGISPRKAHPRSRPRARKDNHTEYLPRSAPGGAWRTNLKPPSCRPRMRVHNADLAGVSARRKRSRPLSALCLCPQAGRKPERTLAGATPRLTDPYLRGYTIDQ